MTLELSQNGTTIEFKHLHHPIMATSCQEFTITTETATVGGLTEARDSLNDLVCGGTVHLNLQRSEGDIYSKIYMTVGRIYSQKNNYIIITTNDRLTREPLVTAKSCGDVQEK